MEIAVFIFAIGLVVVQGIFSHFEGGFINNEVVNEEGDRFLSFTKHGAMYADLIVLCPVLYLIAQTSNQWSMPQIIGYNALAFVFSTIMNMVVYPKMAGPGCHYDNDMKLTAAGWLHFYFMGLVLSALFLFYLTGINLENHNPGWITIAICISLPFQTIAPDYVVKGRIDKLGALQLLPLWGVMVFAYYNATQLHWIAL